MLILTHDAARHPFRQSLPPHIFAQAPVSASARKPSDADDKDWKLFLLSFAAFFTVAYSFIA